MEFHGPPVKTREEQVAREMQEREISVAAAQDKTEAGSSRFAPAIPHANVTDFAQLSSDAQPRPTSKTLVTRSSQPVSNALHFASFPENDDPDAFSIFFLTMFSLLVISVGKYQAPRRDRAQQAANSFLLERSRECVPPWAVTNDSAPSFPRASRPRRTKASLDWRGVLECLDRRRYVSLAEYDHRHMELHRAIKEL